MEEEVLGLVESTLDVEERRMRTMSDNYPRGKLSDDDEGETDLAITVRDRTVVVAFAKPMRWIAMDKRTALAIARTLVQKANEIE